MNSWAQPIREMPQATHCFVSIMMNSLILKEGSDVITIRYKRTKKASHMEDNGSPFWGSSSTLFLHPPSNQSTNQKIKGFSITPNQPLLGGRIGWGGAWLKLVLVKTFIWHQKIKILRFINPKKKALPPTQRAKLHPSCRGATDFFIFPRWLSLFASFRYKSINKLKRFNGEKQ